MTIHKAQGQTLERVGVFLPSPCFSHGQLYVAASRVGHPDHMKFAIDRDENGERRTRWWRGLTLATFSLVEFDGLCVLELMMSYGNTERI